VYLATSLISQISQRLFHRRHGNSSAQCVGKEHENLPGTVWIDVEDLFEYALHNKRPSGIQRLEFELGSALATLPQTDWTVRFVRHDSERPELRTIPWNNVESLFRALCGPVQENTLPPRVQLEPASLDTGAKVRVRRASKSVLYLFPPAFRRPLSQAYQHQRAVFELIGSIGRGLLAPIVQAFRHQRAVFILVGSVVRAIFLGIMRRIGQSLRRKRPILPRVENTLRTEGTAALPQTDPIIQDPESDGEPAFNTAARPGDVLLVVGSPWFHPNYARIVAKAKRERGVRFALLIYDLIPIRHPEWCDENLTRVFTFWMRGVLPLADRILTISRASAADVARYQRELGLTSAEPPQPIPIGTGFSATVRPSRQRQETSRRPLPAPESYALIVSTIEARKNHILLFRVWRRLLNDLPRHKVPTLVFAGRVGWLVSDLMQQLRNARFLDGKIILFEDPTDDELQQLYAGCLFTLFPSFYEGWGLPVTESLGFGRPCVISNATSLPEAGGSLARYFDPEDGQQAYRVIREIIENPDEIAAWRERVARDFKPVPWQATAEAVLAALPQHPSYQHPSDWSGREDSNLRPLAPKASALPG
jgi:glycosyltransferase involved in cell wall biosynthesis